MSATSEQIARLRRMVAEPTTTTYSDDDLAEYIERYPLLDARGEEPYTWDDSTDPPTQDANEDWIPTYDLNAAAADIWDEKAAVASANYDFSADGGSYSRGQVADRYMQRARYYRSRRSAGHIHLHKWPEEGSVGRESVINRAEGGD